MTKEQLASSQDIVASLSPWQSDMLRRLSKKTALEIPFLPADVQLFERLHASLNDLKERLKTQRETALRARPKFDDVPEVLRKRLESAVSTDAIEKLLREAQLAADQVDDLRQQVADLRQIDATRIAKQRQIAAAERRVFAFEKALTCVDSVDTLRRADREVAAAELLAAQANQELEKFPIDGVGSSVWHALWTAAENYVREHETENAYCALCQRQHDTVSRERLARFATIASDQVEVARQATLQRRRDARAAVTRTREQATEYVSRYSADPLEGDTTEMERIVKFCQQGLSGDFQDPPLSAPPERLSAHVEKLELELDALQRLDAGGADALKKTCADAEEFARLLERKDDLVCAADIDQKIAHLKEMDAQLKGRRLSQQVKRLAEDKLAGRLKIEFVQALKDLKVQHLPLEMNSMTRKGQPQTKLALADAVTSLPIARVFSSGEQSCAALAFFLAEVAATGHSGPVVLDDPMSSLDGSRRKAVAKRLAEEALRRQVVVFTHDAFFAIALEEAATYAKAPLAWRHIRALNRVAGHVDEREPRSTGSTNKRMGRLRHDELRAARKAATDGDPDTYDMIVTAIYAELRIIWELLTVKATNGVVKPGTFSVHTNNLLGVKLDSTLAEMITHGMAQCSFRLHDNGSATTMHRPSIDELEATMGLFDRAAAYLKALPKLIPST